MLKGKVPSPAPHEPAGKGVSLRILGIDPGMVSTGYGLIDSETRGPLTYFHSGVLRPRSLSTSHRLQQIYRGLLKLIEDFSPQIMAVERPFFGKNVKSAMLLGQARGAALLAAAEAGLEVQEFSPLEVKQAVVGYGRATKEQIQCMVTSLLQVPHGLKADAADALAVALCLAHTLPLQSSLGTAPRNRRRSLRWTEKDLGGLR